MSSVMYPAQREEVDDLGFLRTPDRLPELSGSHVRQLEVCKIMMGTCGPYNLVGSTIAGIRARSLQRLL